MVDKEMIMAMAVAVIAEENGVDPEKIVVRSFRAFQKSSLEQYLEENQMIYHKYRLEDEKA